MKKMFWKSVSLSVFAVFFLASAVLAIDFQGTSAGVFSGPAGPAGMVAGITLGGTHFFWGSTFPGGPSTLDFAGVGLPGFSGNFGDVFKFGTLTYFNGTSLSGTQADSVNLGVTLTFSLPPGLIGAFAFPIGLINVTDAFNPLTNPLNADFVELVNPANPPVVEIGGKFYTLTFDHFGTPTDGGSVGGGGLQFFVNEGATSASDMFGKLTEFTPPPSNVPEPATMFLLGSGLLGLAGLRRKFKK